MPRVSYKQRYLLRMEESIVLLILLKIIVDYYQRNQQLQEHQHNDDRRGRRGGGGAAPPPLSLQGVLLHPTVLGAIELFARQSQKRYIRSRGRRQRPYDKFSLDLSTIPFRPEDSQPWLNDMEFLTAYRMSRTAFSQILSKIENHPVFQRGKRGPEQAPVRDQLLTLLHYLSSPGSSASGARIRNHFHISYGCKDKYIHRCVRAIRSCMRSDYYTWPDAQERRRLTDEFQQRYKVPNAILIVDGTTFPLASKPERDDAADYSGRKGGYTITNLFFCDIHRKIRYYISGWAGCAHDNRIWTNSKLYKNPTDYFSPNEYVIGDSAFDNGPNMVTTYKAPTGGTLQGSKMRFNTLLSSPRVISEHVNGIMKGRWNWLNSIPNVLDGNSESMKKIIKIVDVIVILHNFLTDHNLTEEEDDTGYFYNPPPRPPPIDDAGGGDHDHDLLLSPEDDDELNRPIHIDAPSNTRREQLRAYLSERGIL